MICRQPRVHRAATLTVISFIIYYLTVNYLYISNTTLQQNTFNNISTQWGVQNDKYYDNRKSRLLSLTTIQKASSKPTHKWKFDSGMMTIGVLLINLPFAEAVGETASN